MATTKTAKGLVEYAKAQLGKGYWYGTYGQTGSYSVYREFRNMYPKYYDCWSFESFTSQYGQRVHDCVGLIKGYLWSETPTSAPVYNATQDKSANGMYDAAVVKGDIDTIPEKPGLLVWKSGHIGVYIGNGEVIEAAGHANGVVKTKVKARPWTNWCECPYISYAEEPKPAPAKSGYTATFKTIRKGDKGAEVLLLQKLLKVDGYKDKENKVLALDGDFGSRTEYALNRFQTAERAKGNECGTDGKNDGTCGGKCWKTLLGV